LARKRRASIKTCTKRSLVENLQDRLFYVKRHELILMAGALNNKTLLKDLGSAESSIWYEGRRAADPDFANPYWPEEG
jgi:hypothetical protein